MQQTRSRGVTARRVISRYPLGSSESTPYTRFQYDLSDSHDALGGSLSDMGRPAGALEAIQSARAIRQRIVEANPANVYIQDALAKTLNRIGNLLGQLEKPAEALDSLQSF